MERGEIKRSREDELIPLIEESEPKALIIFNEPRRFKVLIKVLKRNQKLTE